ncbi:MAG: hypothetical protein JNL72_15770 [Flavipsychrobacter sp.]|nr:hypothetical protein [Flavipsychrobacter sp.]
MFYNIIVDGTDYEYSYEEGTDWVKIVSPWVVSVNLRDRVNIKFYLGGDEGRSVINKLNDDLPLFVDEICKRHKVPVTE